MFVQKMPVTYQLKITAGIFSYLEKNYVSMCYYMQQLLNDNCIELCVSWPEYQVLELRSELAEWLDYNIGTPSELYDFYCVLVEATI